MKAFCLLFLSFVWRITVPASLVAALQDSITAEQLLGSHFGIPGIPVTYDYVILGGGTAGLTLARRLAADARYTVAVVNAGDFAEFANGNFSQVPALASMFGGSNPFLKNPLLDFDQYTTPQQVSIAPDLSNGVTADYSTAIERQNPLLCFAKSTWGW